MTNPLTQTPEIQTGLSINAPGSLIPTEQLKALCDALDAPHSYDNDPIYQKGVADAYNSGIGQAAIIVEQAAAAFATTEGEGEMPATIPSSTLEDLYNKIMEAQKPVPSVPETQP